MSDSHGILRGISWRDLCPWLILFRAFGLAISLSLLLLSGLALVATPLGWRLASEVLSDDDRRDLANLIESRAQFPWERSLRLVTPDEPFSARTVLSVPAEFFRSFGGVLTGPFSVRKAIYQAIGWSWTLLVWGFAGGVTCRIAVVRLGRGERVGVRDTMRFVGQRIGSYFAAPLFPLFGVGAVTFGMFLLGLLMRLDVGVLVAGLFWWAVLIGGFIAVWFLVGLLFGWPLMFPAIGAEETGDAFEALHRSFSYTYQRPFHYAIYVLLAAVIGTLGYLVVGTFCLFAVEFSHWGVSWGMGEEPNGPEIGGLLSAGLGTIRFFDSLVKLIPGVFCHSFFWCTASAVYLLLRRDLDQTELDEVYMEQEAVRYELPSLQPGETASSSDSSAQPPSEDEAS